HTRFSRDWSSDVCSSDLGEHFFMPESGQTSFKLFFPPLDPKITKIDFIESDCDDCFKIWGIQLVPSKKGIVTYKPEKAKVEKLASLPPVERSEERRVGKEWRS